MLRPVLRYREIAPGPPLDRLVRCFWALEGALASAPPTDRILPDGCPELVFHHGDPFERLDPGDGRPVTQPRAAVVGQLDRYLDLRPTGRIGLFGVRLRPEGSAALLRVRADELTGRSLPVADVLAGIGRELEARVLEASDDAGRVAACRRLLGPRAMVRAAPWAVRRAVALARQRFGAVRITELAAEAGVTPRHLERLFAREVGLGPKLLARVLRFRRALEALEAGADPTGAARALRLGYADQAHCIREFRSFAGVSPSAWLRRPSAVAAPFNAPQVANVQDPDGDLGQAGR